MLPFKVCNNISRCISAPSLVELKRPDIFYRQSRFIHSACVLSKLHSIEVLYPITETPVASSQGQAALVYLRVGIYCHDQILRASAFQNRRSSFITSMICRELDTHFSATNFCNNHWRSSYPTAAATSMLGKERTSKANLSERVIIVCVSYSLL